MGLFSKTEPVIVEGVIARIGIISHSDHSMWYGIHLQGRKERFDASHTVGMTGVKVNTDLSMAQRGDRVRFGTHPKKPLEVIESFENITMKSDLG